jgi:CHAT domain-containing protein/tetratricopeptide (TPR) repeat protein
LVALVLRIELNPAIAQDADQIALLREQVNRLRSEGRHSEAIPVAQRYIEIVREKHGEQQAPFAKAILLLALCYHDEGRYAEAEALNKRSLFIMERALGADHPDLDIALNNLAGVYRAQGRYVEAEPLYTRALAISERAWGRDDPIVAMALSSLAALYAKQGRYADAEPALRRSITIMEKAFGLDHHEVSVTINNLAGLYHSQGRYTEAEPLFKRVITAFERTLGSDHPNVATVLNNLAETYRMQGHYTKAEPLYKRGLEIKQKALPPDHPSTANALNNLAGFYQVQGRYGEAEPLYKRSLTIREKALGSDHPDLGGSLNNLGTLYRDQGRYGEAEVLYRRSLTISERALGLDHPSVGTMLDNLASLCQRQGRYAEAEAHQHRSMKIIETALGSDHPLVAVSFNTLASIYESQGRYGEAQRLYERSLKIKESTLGPEHPEFAGSLSNLALLHFKQRDWTRAFNYWRRSTGVMTRRAALSVPDVGQGLTEKLKTEAEQFGWQFWGLVKAAHRVAAEESSAEPGLAREMFQAAQWAQGSEAAASLAQMAARGAKGNPKLAVLVRDRQDRVAEWHKREGMRSAAIAQSPEKRDRAVETANVARLEVINAQIGAYDKQLAAEFPEYTALSRPEPLSVEEVQAQLDPDEALIVLLDTLGWPPTPEETFIWVVTKSAVRWVRSDLGRSALIREVAALRCGLDAAAWSEEGAQRCVEALGIRRDQAPAEGQPLRFDTTRAHALYKALFSEVVDLIAGKHLLIVPSGSLTQLPFHVLVTAPSKGNYRSTRWLARDHAVTVLPAVSSLKALRRVARSSAARLPMIGFGNPLLDGEHDHPQYGNYYRQQAALARANQNCPLAIGKRVASMGRVRRSIEPVSARGSLADLGRLKAQAPLPETAKELCDVAAYLKADPKELRLGARATEQDIKALSASGALANYRVVHFATHGTLAGQLSRTAEPGLILTPPAQASEEDDGYLSASEITALKLDAEWVILSACNTAGAADGGNEAQALSGLARAFFYAGSRALLVSHWEVDTDASVAIITSAVAAIRRDSRIGRSEALRRAMLAIIDTGKPQQAHPTYWAPFVVAGEGARR